MTDQPSIDTVVRVIALAEQNAEETCVAIGRLMGAVANAREKNGLHFNATAEAMQCVTHAAMFSGSLVDALRCAHKALHEAAEKHGLGGITPQGGGGGK